MEEEKNLTESNQPEERTPLTKEEILARSRKENAHGDERSTNAVLRAGYFAMIIGGVLCVLMYWLYYHLLHETREELFVIYSVMWAVFSWVQFHYAKRKAQLALGILWTVAAVCFIIVLILQLTGLD